jgi:hypothetical protein
MLNEERAVASFPSRPSAVKLEGEWRLHSAREVRHRVVHAFLLPGAWTARYHVQLSLTKDNRNRCGKSTDEPRTGATRALHRSYPTGGLGHPEEVAAAVAFLASAEASYVNGTEILVDGGVLVEPGMKIALNGQHAVICPAYQ